MERERIREREPEVRLHDYAWNEQRFEFWDKENKRFAALPRVIKFNSLPWTQVHQGYHKVFTGSNLPELAPSKAPIYTMSARLQILNPGGRSGRHRHFGEALFYILEGKGYEIHDGVRYDWEAGDVMCVPTYCIHQHFANPDTGAYIFYVAGGPYMDIGLGQIEQMELHPEFHLPEGAEPVRGSEGSLIGYRRKDGFLVRLLEQDYPKEAMERKKAAAQIALKPENTYDEYIKLYLEEGQWRRSCLHVVKAKDLPWENTRQGKIKYILHPKIPAGLLCFEAFLQEIPPGGRSGKHRHVGEEVHYILEGKGYDIQDGVRYDWEKQDIVCIPVLTTHQHFNSDPHHPALFISVQCRIYHFIGHGGVEHLEDALEWRKARTPR